MPRRKRIYLPGFPYHLVQRGNNRQPCFNDRFDYRSYLELWREKSRWYGVQVHAYCLMTNHVHFVITSDVAEAISNTMKVVGSRYAYHFNKRHHRTGTLWEGRHKSSVIDSERYLLACMRYVESNPTRAGMVDSPAGYEWSSYRQNIASSCSWLTPHPVFLSLGRDPQERGSAYRKLFDKEIEVAELNFIRRTTHYSVPIGGDGFRRQLESQFGMRRVYEKRGRPAKNSCSGSG